MKRPSLQLMYRLLWIYASVALFGVILISLNNLFINGFSWEELIRFNLKAKLLIGLLMVISFLLLSYIRLRKVLQFLDRSDQAHEITMVWHRLLLMPHEIFLGMLVFGVIVSPVYHLIDFWLLDRPFFHWGKEELLVFVRDFLFDQSLTLTLAVLLHSLLRHRLRSYLLTLPALKSGEVEWKTSFIRPLLLTFISIVLITIFSMMWYVLNSIVLETPIHLFVLSCIALVTFAFGLLLFLLLTLEFRRELQLMIEGIISLVGGERTKLHGKMPVISRDEVGQLAVAFNELQDYIAKEYADLEYELHLAYQVQQSLLPDESQWIGACHICASFQSMKEVGGDLYDTYILEDGRFAVLVGDVSGKGISAALLMSAMILLFKMEIGRGGSAGEVLTRLNQLMVETLRGKMYITLGLAIFDLPNKKVEYASAGHVAPYMLRCGEVDQIMISSLPLGIVSEEIYREIVVPFQPHDEWIFYTDGWIEKLDSEGQFIGFDRFEQFLQDLDPAEPLQSQLLALKKRLGEGSSAKYEDDRTLILLRWEGKNELSSA